MPLLPLQTPRLRLRMMRTADAGVLAAYRNDSDVARFQSWELPFTAGQAVQMLARQDDIDGPTAGRWVQIALETADGTVVGDTAIGLDATGSVATLGYTVAPPWQGNGYAGEAVGALVTALFERTSVHRMVATLDPDHHASMRVVEPLGFRCEGLARHSELIRGEWCDDLRFALLRADHLAWAERPRDRPSDISLIPVTADNLGAVRRLETFRFQRSFVAPMEITLAQALVPGTENGQPVRPWFRAIAADGEVAGFVLVAAAAPGNPEPYLWRFLIDRRHQRRGIGGRAIAALVAELRSEGHVSLVCSWRDGPGGPRAFYEGLGFVPTGELDDGEVVARLACAALRS